MTEDIKLNKAEKAWKPSSKRTAADKDRGEEDADGNKTQASPLFSLCSFSSEFAEPTACFASVHTIPILFHSHTLFHPSQWPLF